MVYPMKKTTLRRRNVRRRRVYPRRAIVPRYTPMRNAPTGSFCSRAETYSLQLPAGVVQDYTMVLNDLPICNKLSTYFQYYRITSIQMRFKPNSDTYAPGTNAFLPYLYFLYDKSGSIGAINATQFESAGAKPIRVDDKTIVRKWRPSVRITPDDNALSAVPMFKSTPWIPTLQLNGAVQNNNVKHFGSVFYISKVNPADAQVYDVDITVTVQFRKPNVLISQSESIPV